MKKRLWAVLLTICLVAALLPTTALAADPVLQGYCGGDANAEKVTWELAQNNEDSSNPTYTLTISGTGAMKNYTGENEQPWRSYAGEITGVVIEDGVTTIGAHSLRQLTAINSALNIPASIKTIGSCALYRANFNSYTVDENNSNLSAKNGVLFNADQTKLIAYPIGSTETEYVAPATVTNIGAQAFSGSKNLTRVDFSAATSLTQIGQEAFSDAKNLDALFANKDSESVITVQYEALSGLNSIEIHCDSLKIAPYAALRTKYIDFSTVKSIDATFDGWWRDNYPFVSNGVNYNVISGVDIVYVANAEIAEYLTKLPIVDQSTNAPTIAIVNGGAFMDNSIPAAKEAYTPSKAGVIFDAWEKTDDYSIIGHDNETLNASIYQAKWSEIIAAVGSVNYSTLTAAINAAQDGDTVTMLKNVTEAVTIPAGKTITLDLNGNDITVNDGCAIVNKGTLTVTGSGNVTTSANGSAAVANFPGATANLNGGTYSSSKWYVIKNLGTMTIDGPVTVKKPDDSTDTSSLIDNGWVSSKDTVAGESVSAQADKAKLTIKSGDFTGKAGSASCSVVKNDDYGVLEINGGRFDSTNNTGTSNATTILNWNVATISGGTFKGSYPISNGSYDNTADQGKLTITGGNFSGTSSLFGQAQGGTSGAGKVTITDGSFKAPQFGAFDYAVEISGGSFSQSVERKYLDQSLNAELKRTGGETPYSYYPDVAAAAAAAQPGDTVTDLKATTESKVTLTMKYNDGATADITYNVASGTTITLPAPTRIGYTFNGWYDGSTFYAAGASYKVSATVTLNASWSYISSGSSSSDPIYSVSTPSKTENGTVTVSPKSASRGDTVTVTVKPDSGYVLETLTVTDKNGNELTLKDKGDGKYTFTMPSGKVEVKATFMDDNTMLNFFVDVKSGDYYYDAVLWAAKNGITSGTDAVHFSPEQPCTRAQIVTFLWRAAGAPEPKGTAASLTDVVSGSYYEKAVAWAIENGITTGTGDGEFSPDDTCTRAQAVTFLARALNAKAADKAAFSDVPADSYFADAVAWAAANGVTEGIGGGLFGSDNDCTRGQIVTFLYRAYNK